MNFQAQPRVKKPPDFISRNRRAVRGAERERRGKGRDSGKQLMKTHERSSDTVEISKSYLDRLLQMSVAPPPTVAQHTAFAARAQDTAPHVVPAHTAANGIPSVPHIQPDHTRLWPPPAPTSDGQRNGRSDVATRAAAGLSSREQWLADLARQCEEQTARREVEETLAKDPQEEYFPWGRPGGGAPIRTISGTLLTNYSTRGRAVEDMRSSNPRHCGTQIYPPEQQAAYGSSDHVVPAASQQLQATYTSLHSHKSRGVPHKTSPQRSSFNAHSPHKSQFARGVGPHVDTFVLSQKEEQRRKDLIHQEELAAQIAERQRQREAERQQYEKEEREAEERVRREIEELNMRSERERERRHHKAEQQGAVLQTRVQEAEETACREKQQLAQRGRERGADEAHWGPPKRAAATQPSRIPLPSKVTRKPPPTTHTYLCRCDKGHEETQHWDRPHPTLQNCRQSRTKTRGRHPFSHRPRAPSPPLPAVARTMAGRQPPYSIAPSHPPTSPPSQHPPLSPIVPALAKKLALQTTSTLPTVCSPTHPPPHTLSSTPAHPHTSHPHPPPIPPPTSPPLPAVARRLRLAQPTAHHITGGHSPALPIHHTPSCQPCSPTTLNLPTLTPSQEHTGTKFPSQPPLMVAKQQTILHQLAILREGILSQRNSLDMRLQ